MYIIRDLNNKKVLFKNETFLNTVKKYQEIINKTNIYGNLIIEYKKERKNKEMKEMEKLISLLKENKIPFEVKESYNNSKQVFYPNVENKIIDVICFNGSFGYENGLLEIMNKGKVTGHLTAQEVFKRIMRKENTKWLKKLTLRKRNIYYL